MDLDSRYGERNSDQGTNTKANSWQINRRPQGQLGPWKHQHAVWAPEQIPGWLAGGQTPAHWAQKKWSFTKHLLRARSVRVLYTSSYLIITTNIWGGIIFSSEVPADFADSNSYWAPVDTEYKNIFIHKDPMKGMKHWNKAADNFCKH